MKKVTHAVVKRPNNQAAVFAVFNNQMRQPHGLVITKAPLEPHQAPTAMYEGDEADVFHLFEGLAEIAWEMGWRPAGLGPVLAAVVKEFKLSKAG